MDSLESAYNQAFDMIKKGHSKEEVLLKFASEKDQLAPLLEISQTLLLMPKNIVPTPMMQKKYAADKAKSLWLAWLHVSKFAGVSVSLMLLVSAFAATGYAAWQSTPGHLLFTVKKAEEQIQLTLTTSQQEKANLQIAIAQQRLNDAQAIFGNPNSDAAEKNDALQELASQTSNAVQQLNTITSSNPKSADSHPLLTSLDSITSQQSTLLQKIKAQGQTGTEAQNALLSLKQNTAQLSQIKQLVAVANSDQALTSLSDNPNSVVMLGNISKISNGQITVEKTIFELNSQTSIQDEDGNRLSASQLALNSKVNIIGIKNNNNIVASQITVLGPDNSQTIALTSGTTTPTMASATQTADLTVKKPDGATSTKDSSASSSPANNPNSAIGTFIFESPEPQFAQ